MRSVIFIVCACVFAYLITFNKDDINFGGVIFLLRERFTADISDT